MSVRAVHAQFTRRLVAAAGFVCIMFGVLLVRLWYLQCVYGAYFRDLSENNRIRTIRTVPPRGTIFDRDGRVLVRNRPAFDVALMLEDVPNLKATISTLSEITGREEAQLYKTLHSRVRGHHFEPQVVMSDVSREELAKVKVNAYRLPGLIVNTIPARAYPEGALAAQVLGFAREISKSQLDAVGGAGIYRNGDLIGQAGIEKQWEDYLRGRSGYVQVEVDARGNRRGELGIVDDQVGGDLQLTVDLDLQKAAEEALGGRRGALVALDPRNGEVLALASSPPFDANIFSGRMVADEWQDVATNKDKPLTNRAIASKYPPGSTFKLFMAIAGLAGKKISPQTQVTCPGYFMLKGRPYKCHKQSGHGTVNLQKAITVSCNAYFYRLGQELGITGIYKYARMFGFGGETEIDLPGEDAGVLPSEAWKRRLHHERWYPGDTIPVSIGQGYLNVTPLQMAVAISVIANGGTVYRPLLVKKVSDHRTGETHELSPTVVRKLPIDPDVFETVRTFAVDVVNDPHGTGKRAALPNIEVAGKTGTAQVGALGKESLGEQFKDHAWFISFAPAENPTIAIAVIIENIGHGGEFAAPVSRAVMETYFRKLGMLPPPEEPAADAESVAVVPAPHGAPAAPHAAAAHAPEASPARERREEPKKPARRAAARKRPV